MPLPLSDADLAMLYALAAPIDQSRQPEFMEAVTSRLEASPPAAVGPGTLHRTARTVLADFWSPPPDLRQGRLGPRGPRNA
jgi:hypothetical protein